MSKANVASKSSSAKTISAKKKTPAKVYFKRYWQLYAMLALPMIYFIIFKYIPMQYIQIAWKDYKLNMSVWQMPVTAEHGMKYFNQAFHNMDFWYSVRNTLLLNLLDLILGFPAPIIFALILNELRSRKLKKTVQTVAYMPHFLSWVIISSLALQLFAPSTGLINVVFEKMGIGAVPFLNDSTHWVFTYIFIGIWQSFGWNSIIYLAAITSINPELYEAAAVDGAGRFKKMWHVTLPSIRPTIVVLLIINLGHILGSSFDRPFALRNNTVMDVANVISTFVYTNGIKGLKFSMTTAVGLFQSVIGLIFLLISNKVAKRLGERGIF